MRASIVLLILDRFGTAEPTIQTLKVGQVTDGSPSTIENRPDANAVKLLTRDTASGQADEQEGPLWRMPEKSQRPLRAALAHWQLSDKKGKATVIDSLMSPRAVCFRITAISS